MRIVLVDDESQSRASLRYAVKRMKPQAEILEADGGISALNLFQDLEKEGKKADIAFLDIEMPDMDGITLGKVLNDKYSRLNIIYVSAYDRYAMKAYQLHVSGYILKPVDLQELRDEFSHLRYPLQEEETKKVYFRCFGNFEILVDDRPLLFKLDKTKEMLAYLFDHRGTMCSNNEIMVNLWEDDNHVSYLKQLRKDLTDTLESLNLGHMLMKKYGKIGLLTDDCQSDLQEWLDSGADDVPGTYMEQYSWAEETNANLFFGKYMKR